MSHLIKIYAVRKFSYFRLWYLRVMAYHEKCSLQQMQRARQDKLTHIMQSDKDLLDPEES